ncbi:MAG: DnaB-like helicase C-terminal domain-containing protein, partial [Nitrosomonadales bacterium]
NGSIIAGSQATTRLTISEDVEQIYGQSVQQLATQENDFSVNDSSVRFGEMKKGELVVIATRDKLLGDDFKCRIVSHVACKLGQPVTVFSTSDSFIMFSRKLIGYLSQITEDKDIYSGKLNDAELRRLSSVLAELSTVNLGIYPFTYIPIDELCKRAIMHFQQRSDAGLIFVDTVKNISDYDPRMYPHPGKQKIGIKSRLIRLKELANELMVPIIVTVAALEKKGWAYPSRLTNSEAETGFVLSADYRKLWIKGYCTEQISNYAEDESEEGYYTYVLDKDIKLEIPSLEKRFV